MGKFFGIDAVFMRMIWVLVALFPPVSTFVAIVAYIVLGYIIPEEKDYIDVWGERKNIYETGSSFIGAWQYPLSLIHI